MHGGCHKEIDKRRSLLHSNSWFFQPAIRVDRALLAVQPRLHKGEQLSHLLHIRIAGTLICSRERG